MTLETEPEIYKYMKFRAEKEDQAFTLSPERFQQLLDQGVRTFYEVRVTSEGHVISDPKNVEILVAWKAANPGPYAGKTSTRCVACFEDFCITSDNYWKQRSDMPCTCTEELCKKCWCIHVTRTALQQDDTWAVGCPTCRFVITMTQDSFLSYHQTTVQNHWLE